MEPRRVLRVLAGCRAGVPCARPPEMLAPVPRRRSPDLMGPHMAVLIRRENLTFRNTVVYLAGHAFVNCTFEACTMVVREATGVLERCNFNACVWHLDVFVTDRDHWARLLDSIGPLLLSSLPATATAEPAAVSPEPGSATRGRSRRRES